MIRAGFPFVFLEDGVVEFRSEFNLPFLLLDLLIGLAMAFLLGFMMRLYQKRNIQ